MTQTRVIGASTTQPTTVLSRASQPHHAAPEPVKRRWTGTLRSRVPIILTLLAVGLLYQINIGGWPVLDNDDEGTYVAQAWSVLHQDVLAHYTYWYDHPPLGWIQIAVLLEPMVWFTGLGDGTQSVVIAGRAIMGIIAVINAGLLYKLAKNMGVPALVALVVPLLWAFSPLTQYFGRQVFLDNITIPWLLGAFVLVSGKPNLGRHLMAGACFGVAFLSKETAVLAAPGLMLMLWQSAWKKTRVFALVGAAVVTCMSGLAYLLFAGIKGEILSGEGHVSLVEALEWQVSAREGSGWILTEGTSANQIFSSWLVQDPFLILIGAAFTVVALFFRQSRPISLVILVFVALGLRPSGYLPAMFVLNLLPFMAICIVYVLWKAWDALGRFSSQTVTLTMRAVLIGAITIPALIVTQSWSGKLDRALVADDNAAYEESLSWIDQNLPKDSVVLVDDNSWNDLVALGWSTERWEGPIWHFKLDRDPEAQTHLSEGWRDVDYIFVGTAFERQIGTINVSWEQSPQVMSAFVNSEVVQAWGEGENRVELRVVNANSPDSETACDEWECPRSGSTEIPGRD